jgi:hypothetical protein
MLQPRSWIRDRTLNHFVSKKLYLHGLVTAVVALLFVGIAYWPIALVIFITHILIDGWKSYQCPEITYFIIDQVLHMLVIIGCWYFFFGDRELLIDVYRKYSVNAHAWIFATAVVFLTAPAGILIGQLTKRWRDKIINPESLENAGKWIGMIERLIVFIFVLLGEYAAISLLIAAKGIIRFNEKDRPEEKTEYLVIGTLLSIGIALIIGQGVKHFM